MSRYDIDPEGVQRVVTSTGTDAGEFETLLQPMGGYVESVVAGCGSSGAIVPALDAFFEVQSTRITRMGTQVNACLTGAVQATNAYLRGDLEMVATCQTNASQARISEPPK